MTRPLPISGRRPVGNALSWLIVITGLWLWTWWNLSVEWSANEQYEYGFAVPFLFVYIIVKRGREGFQEQQANWVGAIILAGAWGILLFSELLRRHDPIWRLTGTSMMIGVTASSLVWLYRCGGIPLVRTMLFPLAFAWLALPWPVPVEFHLTQSMMSLLSGATVIFMNWAGVAALQHGNLIELTNGLVGIDTACSGIQSLQASLMAAVFLGEFYPMNRIRRIILPLSGWMIAIFVNFCRVVFLTYLVHLQGEEAVDLYHDVIGYISSAVIFLLLMILARTLGSAAMQARPSVTKRFPVVLSGCDGILLLIGIFCIPFTASSWFAAVSRGNMKSPDTPRWGLRSSGFPEGWQVEGWKPAFHEKSMLRYSAREGLIIRTSSGDRARLVHFFWEPGKSMPGIAFSHTPQLCMPSIGWKESVPPAPVTLTVHGFPLPCIQYRFRMDGVQQVVCQALCSAGRTSTFMLDPTPAGGRASRLSMLWRAPREQVNEELLVYLPVVEYGEPDLQNHLATEILEQVLYPYRLE